MVIHRCMRSSDIHMVIHRVIHKVIKNRKCNIYLTYAKKAPVP